MRTLQKQIKETEANYYSDLLNSCQNSSRQTWQRLAEILNTKKAKSCVISKIFFEEKMLTTPEDIANALNKHFCSVGNRLSRALPDTGEDYRTYINNNIRESFFLSPVEEVDILREIKNLALNKAPGPDDIGAKLLKLDPDVFLYPLRLIYNRALENGQYPNEMKLAKVIAIYKKGIMHVADNYRPISLLSCFNKIFEKILHRNLMKFLDKHNVLFMHQYGYRKLHSTTLALIEIVDKIKKWLDDRNYVIGIYLDLTKAFDTVNHDILLYKLKQYGIRGHANNFFRSYLTGRKQYTSINGVNSDTCELTCGVPQGSVLGPLFFILYMNDIVNAADANNIRLYADDTGIFLHGRNLSNLINRTREYFRKLQKWFMCNRLTLNATKSYFSIYHTVNKPIPEGLDEIVIGNMKIQRSRTVKYIGLHIDEMLNWNVHVSHLQNSLIELFGIFNQLKDYVSTKLARQIYYSFVYSRINYAIEVYGSCSETSLNRVQVLQNKLLKLLLRLHPLTSTNILHNRMKILKIRDIFELSLLIFVYRNLQGDCPPSLKNYFNRRNTTRNTRQRGQLDYRRARIDLGASRVQYRGAELWNNLSQEQQSIRGVNQFKNRTRDTIIETYQD